MESLIDEIQTLAAGRFADSDVQEFLKTFTGLVGKERVLTYFLQISVDEGDELELGFLTKTALIDVTLSKGRVYSCAIPRGSVLRTELLDQETKWTLKIFGEKTFDYNVVKPGSTARLEEYGKAVSTEAAP